MSVNPTLFPQLVYQQVIARPMGGIPQSAQGISPHTTIAPDWLGCLAPQEMACFKLRLTQLTAIFDGKEEQGLSPEQVKVLRQIHAFCEGIHGPQINGFRVIFPLLLFDQASFHRDIGVRIKERTMNLSDLVNEINEELPVIFSGLQKLLQNKKTVSTTTFKDPLAKLRALFAAVTPDFLRDPARFNLQRRAFELFERCLAQPDELFPLLLRPMDQLEEHCRAGGVLFATSMTESKLSALLGAANLFECALLHYTSSSEKDFTSLERISRAKALKPHTFSIQPFKKSITAFTHTLLEKVRALNLPIVTRQLLALEARAQKGELQAIGKLHQSLATLQSELDELSNFYDASTLPHDHSAFKQELLQIKTSAGEKGKPLIDQALQTFELLSESFDRHTQDTIAVLRLMGESCLGSALTDHASTATALEQLQKKLLQTTSLFIRPIDALVQTHFLTILALSENAELNVEHAMELNEALGSLSVLGHDAILGMEYIASSGVNAFTDVVATNIGSLTEEVTRELTALGIDPGMIGEIASLGEKQAAHGVPHLYPFLNSPIGKMDGLDAPALVFLRKGIVAGKTYLSQLLLATDNNPTTQRDPALKKVEDDVRQFITCLLVLLDGPCETETEAKALCLNVYQHIQKNHPKPTTQFLEQHLDGLPEFVAGLFFSLTMFTEVYSRTLLEIGRQAYLTSADKAAPTPKVRPARRPQPPPAATDALGSAIPKANAAKMDENRILHPAEATAMVKVMVQQLPKRVGRGQSQETVYRNRNMEENALHLETHLTNMAALLQMHAPHSPQAFSDTLERESALALESALKYLFARYEVRDTKGDLYAFSEEKMLFQHQLDVMAKMKPDLDLMPEEIDFLGGLSVMLSNGSRPDQHRDDPRIAALLHDPSPSAAARDAIEALALIQKLLGKEPLPKLQTVGTPSEEDTPALEEVTRCSTAHGKLETWHDQALRRVQSMPPIHHSTLRERLIDHMVQDLPYHLSIIEPLMGKLAKGSLPPCMLNALLHHQGLLLEKSLKLSSFYQAIPSAGNPGMHATFEIADGRPRIYDHDLIKNLDLLPDAELTEQEISYIRSLSNHASFTRYPAKQSGPLPDILARASLLAEIGEGFFDERLSSGAQKLFGPGEHHEWTSKAQKALQALQTEELLPTAQGLLAAAEKLLDHALALRQSGSFN